MTMSPLEERSSNPIASLQCAMSSAVRILKPLLSPPSRRSPERPGRCTRC